MKAKRIVIKLGSNVLTDEHGMIDRDYIKDVARQVAELHSQGFEPIIVTSAAIAAGLEFLDFEERPSDIPSLQAAASVGQAALTETYSEVFREHNLATGLVLITRGDTSNRTTYLNGRNTFLKLLELGVIPVVNENDTVATDEIRFGDNDGLAALVALMVDADLVIMLTDIDGLYSGNPREDEGAEHIAEVCEITSEIEGYASGAGSKIGTGGMITKLRAAKMLISGNVDMVLTHGRLPNVIVDAAKGQVKGTYFRANGCSIMNHKKRWIAFGSIPEATLYIDEGAVKALRKGGVSLLAPGLKSFSNDFKEGALVSIESSEGEIIARGLTSVSSADVFTSEKHLVVHCDALALL